MAEDAEGKKIMKETVTAKPRDALKTGGAHDFAVDLKRVKEGEKYTLTVTLDAGALGLFEETKTFTAPGKSKEKDREKKPDKK